MVGTIVAFSTTLSLGEGCLNGHRDHMKSGFTKLALLKRLFFDEKPKQNLRSEHSLQDSANETHNDFP
jgi:hypothetical protein